MELYMARCRLCEGAVTSCVMVDLDGRGQAFAPNQVDHGKFHSECRASA